MSEVVLVVVCALALPATASTSLAVFPVAGEDRAAVAAVEAWLIESLAEHDEYEVMPPKRVVSIAKKARSAGVRCDAMAPECAARISAIAGVSLSLLARLEGPDSLRLRLVRTQGSSVVRDVSATLSPLSEERKRGVAQMGRAVLLGELLAGEIVVVVAEPQVSISLDGQKMGVSPLADGLKGVAPGVHVVRAEKKGFKAVEREVEVLVGGRARVQLQLEKRPDIEAAEEQAEEVAPGSPLATTGFVVGAAALLATGGFAIGAAVVTPSVDDRANLSARDYNERNTLGQNLLVAAAISGAAAGAGLLLGVVALVVE